MNHRLNLVTLLAVAAFASLTAVAAAPPADPALLKAKVGEPAPDFTLEDTNGKSHSLSDFKGKIVVLEWINPDCPVCRRVVSGGVVANMAKEIKKLDSNVVMLTINSTHYMDAAKSATYLKNNKIDAPALIDKDGAVGRMYGARTTPHNFVIDTKGILRYQGAIDNDKRGRKSGDSMNYVVNAVRQITAGETVSPDQTRPYGCSVKYAKK